MKNRHKSNNVLYTRGQGLDKVLKHELKIIETTKKIDEALCEKIRYKL